jgi:hypothetical protein
VKAITLGFGGAVLIRHRNAECALWIDREEQPPMVIRDVRIMEGVFPFPLPGRGWWRHMYFALAWSFGRRGR